MDDKELAKQKNKFLGGIRNGEWKSVSRKNRETKEEWAMEDSYMSAVRRNPTFSRTDPAARKAFQCDLKHALQAVASAYKERKVSDASHSKKIQKIADLMSQKHKGILLNGKLCIGTAQKALNLHLKYLWCMNMISPPPPHCPLDNTVLNDIAKLGGVYWTQIKSIKKYETLIKKCRKAAGKRNLAEWELAEFNRRLPE